MYKAKAHWPTLAKSLKLKELEKCPAFGRQRPKGLRPVQPKSLLTMVGWGSASPKTDPWQTTQGGTGCKLPSAQQSSTHPSKIIKLHPPVSTGRPSPGGALGLSLDLDNLAFGAREVMYAIGSVV